MGLREDFRHFESVLRLEITSALDERALEVYVEVPPRRFENLTPLLPLMGYRQEDVDKEPPLAYARTNVKPDYRIRALGGDGSKFGWILDLKAPRERLERADYVQQLFDYLHRPGAEALFGVLFNGLHAHLYVNDQIEGRSKSPLGQHPVLKASLSEDDELFRLFEYLTPAFTTDPLRRARELIRKEKARITADENNKRRQDAIRVAVQRIRESPPDNVLQAVMEACSEDWDTTFELPTIQDVRKHWNPGAISAAPLGGQGDRHRRRDGINPALREKIAEVCSKKGWRAIEQAQIRGLNLSLDGVEEKGYRLVPQCPGVPTGLCVQAENAFDARRFIEELDRILHRE